MRKLYNLVVDLETDRATPRAGGIDVRDAADDRTLAWIDQEFGGTWSSEAHAGSNVVAFRDSAPVGFATYDPQGLSFSWLRGIGTERGVGVFGPYGIARTERGGLLGRELLHRALRGLRERGYARALIAAVGDERLIRYYADACGARVAEEFDVEAMATPRPRATVMVSGSGTNLQSVLDRVRDGRLPLDVVSVVSNNPKAYALERARSWGVPSIRSVRWKRGEEPREQYDVRLLEEVRADDPELVVLLGWMHLLSESFVREFPHLLNLHPAFLPLDPERDRVVLPDGSEMPAFRGPDAVGDALRDGRTWTGATVHRVTPSTDRGPVLARKPLRVRAGETQLDVMERLHPLEHDLVATALMRWVYERRALP
ncbi:MAG: GNAT family N-acetyltransferase [Candidatus Eremiobacteraeota bacterium]|nr:GNAT family N-acetyltransferase [Candidatus Eremiobacteraeota bacterium]MBV8284171.1 GNAT family N-acetyltransferase [Candidatus Eremiobacteraeota bacterium]